MPRAPIFKTCLALLIALTAPARAEAPVASADDPAFAGALGDETTVADGAPGADRSPASVSHGARKRAPSAADADPGAPLAVPPGLRRSVDFWVAMNTQYSTSQGVIHDGKYVDKIYQVLDLAGAPKGGSRLIRAAKKRWRDVLLSLHRKQVNRASWPAGLTADEVKVAKLYEDVDEPSKFLNAAHRKRLRFQLGQREHFVDGIEQAGRYLPLMEEIFRREGLPVELTRLPFVESSFNLNARSKVGASGIWQFMRSTGSLFLRIDEAVDERNDPVRETEAAARLLKLNYASLGSWPLAVTAYNHGRKYMMRAVRRQGTVDLPELIIGAHSRSFGFASSNFYAELLAAVEMERGADRYFGRVQRDPPLKGVEIAMPDYVSMRDLCKFLKLDRGRLRALNPALSDAVFGGRLLVPRGYRLRVPVDSQLGREAQTRLFLAGYAQIPRVYKLKAQIRGGYGRRAAQQEL